MRLRAILIVVGATISQPSTAATFTDPKFGLSFEIPEGYELHHMKYAPGTMLVVEKGDVFCAINYGSDSDLPKARVNTSAKLLMKDMLRENGVDGPTTPFVVGDVEGVMAEATVEPTGQRPKAREIVVLLKTTKEHAFFSCFDSEKTFAASKPTFERLFHSVRLQ